MYQKNARVPCRKKERGPRYTRARLALGRVYGGGAMTKRIKKRERENEKPVMGEALRFSFSLSSRSSYYPRDSTEKWP